MRYSMDTGVCILLDFPIVIWYTTCMTKIAKFQKIVERGQWNKIDGVKVDTFTASAVCAVYNHLSPEHQATFVAFPVDKMIRLAYKLLK